MAAWRQVLASGIDLEVTRLDYSSGDGTPPHAHDYEQVGWISSGRFRPDIAEAKDHDVCVYDAFLTATAPVVRAVSFGGRARFVAFESGGIK